MNSALEYRYSQCCPFRQCEGKVLLHTRRLGPCHGETVVVNFLLGPFSQEDEPAADQTRGE